MWSYNYSNDNYLEHRFVDGRKVKYVAKVPLGKNKFRYFYTVSAYQAYLKSKKSSQAQKTIKKTYDKVTSAPSKTIATSKNKETITSLSSVKNTVDKVVDSVRNLDPKAKAVTEAAVKVAKLLAGGYLGSNSILSRVAKGVKEKVREKEQFQTIDQLPKQNKTETADQSQNLVNPDYDPHKARYSMNCAYCSATWDLRRRGYEVEARPFTKEYDTDIAEIASWYSGTSTENFVNVSETTYNDMLEQKEGSYGNFVIYWYGGGGHSVVWSVENNEVMIRDTQLNTVDTYEDYMNKYQPYMESAYYLRTDNRKFNANILEVCRERRIW